jgi:hypothetical protein
MIKPVEMGHAFVFCSKINGKSTDDLMSMLYNVKEHIKDLNITEIMEKQGQSLLSFLPIDKLMCKFLFFILDKTNLLNIFFIILKL